MKDKDNVKCSCCAECINLFKCGNEENPAIAKECPNFESRGYCKCMELCEAYNAHIDEK